MAETATATKPAPIAPDAGKDNGQEAKKPKVGRGAYQTVFKSVDEAKTAVGTRDKGPTRIWKVTMNGKEVITTAFSPDHAFGNAAVHLGVGLEEVGGRPRAVRGLTGLDAVLAAINALPEDERKKVMEQIKSLQGHVVKK